MIDHMLPKQLEPCPTRGRHQGSCLFLVDLCTSRKSAISFLGCHATVMDLISIRFSLTVQCNRSAHVSLLTFD